MQWNLQCMLCLLIVVRASKCKRSPRARLNLGKSFRHFAKSLRPHIKFDSLEYIHHIAVLLLLFCIYIFQFNIFVIASMNFTRITQAHAPNNAQWSKFFSMIESIPWFMVRWQICERYEVSVNVARRIIASSLSFSLTFS